MYWICYFYLAPVNWELHLHLHASRVFFAKAKIKSAKAKIKSVEDRSSELLKLKWKSHLKHCSTTSTRKPQSSMSSIPSHICSHFSILNQNLTLNLRSLCSLYSQSQVSLVSSLNPSLTDIPSTIQTLVVAAAASSPHSRLRLTVHHGLKLLMQTDQLLSLKTPRYIFFLFHLSFSLFGNMIFSPFKFMYISLIFSFLFFWGVLICLFTKTKESICKWKKWVIKPLEEWRKVQSE